jgi:hypothetical protein
MPLTSFTGKTWQRIKNMNGFSISMVLLCVATGVTALVFILRMFFSFSAPSFIGREYNKGIAVPVVFSKRIQSDTGASLNKNTIVFPENNRDHVAGLEFNTGTAYLRPYSFANRVILLLPQTLFYALLCYCSWLMALFLDNISRNRMFLPQNYHLLKNIAQAILVCQGILFILYWLQKDFSVTVNNLSVSIDQSISVMLMAVPDYYLGWEYVITAFIILIIAKAFQRGYLLQREQDLII